MAPLDVQTQPLVCCLGSAIAGNPTQFVLERALATSRLVDWKLITSQVPPDKMGDAVGALELLGFSGFSLLSPDVRQAAISLVEPSDLPLLFVGEITTALRSEGKWKFEHTSGNAIVNSALRIESKRVSNSEPRQESDSAKPRLLIGDSATARSTLLALFELSKEPIVWYKQNENLADRYLGTLEKFIPDVRDRVTFHSEFESVRELDIAYLICCESAPTSSLKSWIEQRLKLEQINHTVFVDATDAVVQEPTRKSFMRRSGNTVMATDWLAEQLAIDFSFWTHRQADYESIRDALDEYLEL